MRQMVITEALAELKTLRKRIEKKEAFVRSYIARQEGLKDPLAKEGGSPKLISEAIQSIRDLSNEVIAIRTAIQSSNLRTKVTILEETRTVAEWLIWRKEVAPGAQQFIEQLRLALARLREEAKKKGVTVVGNEASAQTPNDLIVNINELDLTKEAETLEMALGTLDGKLSLLNATTPVTF